MTSAARTLSSTFACACPAVRTVRTAITAAIGTAVAAVAGWRSSRAPHHGVLDDHTLRDVGIARIDVA